MKYNDRNGFIKMMVSLLGHFRIYSIPRTGTFQYLGPLSLSLMRDADFCAMNMYRLLFCVCLNFFLSPLWNIFSSDQL